MGIKVKELNDCECGYILSGLIELKKVYAENDANEEDYNCVLALVNDFKNNKVYVGEKI